MSLRDRLEGKGRRHLQYRVLVEDPQVAASRLSDAQMLLLAAQADPSRAAELPALEEAVTKAQAALDACYEVVTFDALDPVDYEHLQAEHIDPESGDLDVDAIRAPLIAACARDPELQDPAWWAGQLASGKWSTGERDDLYHAIYLLNYGVPDARLGKG